jgi:hypothetical protein
MQYHWRSHLPAALIAAAASLYASGESKALEFRDISGAWCSATAKITFTRTAMTVDRFATHVVTTEKIVRFKYSDTAVIVFWIRDKKEASAEYTEFSANRRTMFLKGDGNSVPRREYRRC